MIRKNHATCYRRPLSAKYGREMEVRPSRWTEVVSTVTFLRGCRTSCCSLLQAQSLPAQDSPSGHVRKGGTFATRVTSRTLVSALPVQSPEATMRTTLCVLLLSMVAVAPAAAKPHHWHDDDKHWNKHWNGHDDDHDHGRQCTQDVSGS